MPNIQKNGSNKVWHRTDHSLHFWSETYFVYQHAFCLISYIYISQRSVATQLTCNGIFNNHFIANCLQNALI